MSSHTNSELRSALDKLLKNKLATACAIFLMLEIIVLALGPIITPWSPDETNVPIRFSPGFWAKLSRNPEVAAKYVPGHIFGTDHLGRDIFSRIVMGGRVSLLVGFVSTALGLVVGTSSASSLPTIRVSTILLCE